MPEGVCGGDGVCVCVDTYLHSYCSVGQVGGWEEAGALSWVQCAVPRLLSNSGLQPAEPSKVLAMGSGVADLAPPISSVSCLHEHQRSWGHSCSCC